MRIERIEIRVTDMTRAAAPAIDRSLRHRCARSAAGQARPRKVFAEGVVGLGQIRPLAPHHAMPDTYASMISMVKEVWGPA